MSSYPLIQYPVLLEYLQQIWRPHSYRIGHPIPHCTWKVDWAHQLFVICTKFPSSILTFNPESHQEVAILY